MIQGLWPVEKLTMAAPTAIPANPICSRRSKIMKGETSFKGMCSSTHQTRPGKVLTSEMGVSMMRLSPYFFHRPLLTCGTTNGMQEVCPLYCVNRVDKYSGHENVTLKRLKKQALKDLLGCLLTL